MRPGLDVKHSPPSGAEINKVYSNPSSSIACLHGRLKGLYKCSFYLFILILIYIYLFNIYLYYLFIYIILFFCLFIFIILLFVHFLFFI